MSGTDNANNAPANLSAEGPQASAFCEATRERNGRVLSAHRSPNVAQAVLLGGAAAQLGLSLLITIYLARALTPAAFGFFSLVGTTFILARKILDPGFSDVAARDIARQPQRERPILEGLMAYRRVVGLTLAMGLCLFALSQNSVVERNVLLAAAVVLLLTEPAALGPVFQVRQAQGGPALLNVAGGLLVLGGSVLFRRVGVVGTAFGFLLIAREAVTLLFTKLLGERLLGYRPAPGFRGRALNAFLAPALIFGVASLVYAVYFNCDVFFVYALRGHDELGAYAAAFRPINPLLLLPWLLMSPLIPVLSVTAAQDGSSFVGQVRGACGAAVGIGAVALVAGAMLAPDLLQLLYQGQYLEGALSCVSAFRWLAIAFGMVSVTTVVTASLLAARREKLLLAIGISALLANALLNLVLLRHHNFTAAAFVTAATELLFLLGALIAFRVATGRAALTWNSALYLAPAALLAAVLHVISGGPARATCGIVLGVASVIGILLAPPVRRLRRNLAGAAPVIDTARLNEA